MNRLYLYRSGLRMAIVFAAAVTALACSDGKDGPKDEQPWVWGVSVESSYTASAGDDITFTGEGFVAGDLIVLETAQGTQVYELPVTEVSGSRVTFGLSPAMVSGKYDFYAERKGKERVTLARNITIDLGFNPGVIPGQKGKNIMGYVYCGGEPLEGVVVSDGYEVVRTDSDGRYYIASEKKNKLVFISVPGNYMPVQMGGTNVMRFFERLRKDKSDTEHINFELFPEPNDNHMAVVGADFHVANRANNDRLQLDRSFVAALRDQVNGNDSKGVPTYVLTLGDLTWDEFWVSGGYTLKNFVSDSYLRSVTDSRKRSVPFFNCMGNHDNDPAKSTGDVDWEAEGEYRQWIGPVYYSFNLGKVHYIMIDNVEYVNTNGTMNYRRRFADHQLEWLKKDLAMLSDKSAPVVVCTHVQMYNITAAAANDLGNAVYNKHITNYDDFMACFSGFSNVEIFSGHRHKAYNIINPSYPNVTEHNVPAVCATWWWTGYYLDGINVCIDGTPGGFGIFDVKGRDAEYHFRGYGLPAGRQFRSYDRNTIELTPERYDEPKFTGTYTTPYDTADDSNTILVNVWNWGPGWSISMTEHTPGGEVPLTVTPHFGKDPFPMLTYEYQRLHKTEYSLNTGFVSSNSHHLFTATASRPDSRVDIVVTDSYGNEYTEEMARPKAFPITDQEIIDYYYK